MRHDIPITVKVQLFITTTRQCQRQWFRLSIKKGMLKTMTRLFLWIMKEIVRSFPLLKMYTEWKVWLLDLTVLLTAIFFSFQLVRTLVSPNTPQQLTTNCQKTMYTCGKFPYNDFDNFKNYKYCHIISAPTSDQGVACLSLTFFTNLKKKLKRL